MEDGELAISNGSWTVASDETAMPSTDKHCIYPEALRDAPPSVFERGSSSGASASQDMDIVPWDVINVGHTQLQPPTLTTLNFVEMGLIWNGTQFVAFAPDSEFLQSTEHENLLIWSHNDELRNSRAFWVV